MNDVRDSRRKHLDELDKGDEMKEMIERLKKSIPLCERTADEISYLAQSDGNCQWLTSWRGGGARWVEVIEPLSNFDGEDIIRLRPDFQLPDPEIKPPEGYRVVPMEERLKKAYPMDCEVKYRIIDMSAWCLSASDSGWSCFKRTFFAVPSDYVFAEDRNELNGIRWTQVPVKVEPRFVEDAIIKDGLFYACSVDHLRKTDESVLFNLSDLPSIVGFTGLILFRYADGSEQWRYTLAERNRDGSPATPIKARFYIAKKM